METQQIFAFDDHRTYKKNYSHINSLIDSCFQSTLIAICFLFVVLAASEIIVHYYSLVNTRKKTISEVFCLLV